MKEYLIKWKTGNSYGVQWTKALSVVEAKGKVVKEVSSTQPYDYIQLLGSR